MSDVNTANIRFSNKSAKIQNWTEMSKPTILLLLGVLLCVAMTQNVDQEPFSDSFESSISAFSRKSPIQKGFQSNQSSNKDFSISATRTLAKSNSQKQIKDLIHRASVVQMANHVDRFVHGRRAHSARKSNTTTAQMSGMGGRNQSQITEPTHGCPPAASAGHMVHHLIKFRDGIIKPLNETTNKKKIGKFVDESELEFAKMKNGTTKASTAHTPCKCKGKKGTGPHHQCASCRANRMAGHLQRWTGHEFPDLQNKGLFSPFEDNIVQLHDHSIDEINGDDENFEESQLENDAITLSSFQISSAGQMANHLKKFARLSSSRLELLEVPNDAVEDADDQSDLELLSSSSKAAASTPKSHYPNSNWAKVLKDPRVRGGSKKSSASGDWGHKAKMSAGQHAKQLKQFIDKIIPKKLELLELQNEAVDGTDDQSDTELITSYQNGNPAHIPAKVSKNFTGSRKNSNEIDFGRDIATSNFFCPAWMIVERLKTTIGKAIGKQTELLEVSDDAAESTENQSDVELLISSNNGGHLHPASGSAHDHKHGPTRQATARDMVEHLRNFMGSSRNTEDLDLELYKSSKRRNVSARPNSQHSSAKGCRARVMAGMLQNFTHSRTGSRIELMELPNVATESAAIQSDIELLGSLNNRGSVNCTSEISNNSTPQQTYNTPIKQVVEVLKQFTIYRKNTEERDLELFKNTKRRNTSVSHFGQPTARARDIVGHLLNFTHSRTGNRIELLELPNVATESADNQSDIELLLTSEKRNSSHKLAKNDHSLGSRGSDVSAGKMAKILKNFTNPENATTEIDLELVDMKRSAPLLKWSGKPAIKKTPIHVTANKMAGNLQKFIDKNSAELYDLKEVSANSTRKPLDLVTNRVNVNQLVRLVNDFTNKKPIPSSIKTNQLQSEIQL
mgnify:FL=1